jgi:hypothetical protein
MTVRKSADSPARRSGLGGKPKGQQQTRASNFVTSMWVLASVMSPDQIKAYAHGLLCAALAFHVAILSLGLALRNGVFKVVMFVTIMACAIRPRSHKR